MLDTHASPIIEPWLHAIARKLLKRGLSADDATRLALIFGLMSGACIILGFHALAIGLLWCSGILDAVDGRMARLSGTQRPFGAVLDITCDRITEIAVILGLGWSIPESRFALLLVTSSIIVAMTLFLTVAAAAPNTGEKSFYYQPGLGERTEAFIMLTLMILFPSLIILWSGLFLMILWITIGQRFLEARKIFRQLQVNNSSPVVPNENENPSIQRNSDSSV